VVAEQARRWVLVKPQFEVGQGPGSARGGRGACIPLAHAVALEGGDHSRRSTGLAGCRAGGLTVQLVRLATMKYLLLAQAWIRNRVSKYSDPASESIPW